MSNRLLILLLGLHSNPLPSTNISCMADERKQKVVASPDSTTIISGDRHSHMNSRGSLNVGRNKNKSVL